MRMYPNTHFCYFNHLKENEVKGQMFLASHATGVKGQLFLVDVYVYASDL